MQPELRKHLAARLGESPWLERLALQIEFARAFAPLYPSQAEEWGALLDEAEREALSLSADSLENGVRSIETSLAPIAAEAKKQTIHCIGHGHIDMNWMWSWPETVATTRDTFASVLSFMQQYPQFTYTQSQASVYALIEKYDPPMFEEIRQRVKEGRWEVAAVHWVEGDKNIVNGESICRHILFARDYFQEKFGLSPEDVPVDWEPDTFGHAHTIPNFLAQGAAKYYYCCRTGGGYGHVRVGEERPPVFWWQGTDGSRVLVFKETTWYNSFVNIGRNIALPHVAFAQVTGLSDWMNVYGVGNHGGGPTREEIELYLSMQDWPCYPTVVFGTAKKYFETIESSIAAEGLNIPVLDHELNFEFTGCYTSQSLIKQANRLGENYCLDAETLNALVLKDPLADAQLKEAWTNVLFNQFHDILPGSGVRQTREHALGLFQEVGAITGMIKRRAGEALTANLNTAALLPDSPWADEERASLRQGKANAPYVAGTGTNAGLTGHSQGSSGGVRFRPFVLWNPCAWERQEMVEVDLYDMDLDPSRIVARDEEGLQWPTLYLGSERDWAHEKETVMFPAKVPALGYRTYLLMEGEVTGEVPPVEAQSETHFKVGDWEFELDRYRSGLSKVVHVPSDTAYTTHCEPLGNWEFLTESPRGMTSWALGDVGQTAQTVPSSRYSIDGVQRNQGTGEPLKSGSAVLARHYLKVPDSDSTIQLRTLIHGQHPTIEFGAEIDWLEIGTDEKGIPGLRIDFEAFDDGTGTTYESPFGTIHRDHCEDEEVPSLQVAFIPSQTGGISLLQDAKYGHSRHYSTLSLRVLRSSFDPDHAPEVAKSSFRYAVHFHTAMPTPADLVRLGTAFNHPFIVFPANLQEGTGPLTQSFAESKTASVVPTSIKPSLDGRGVIVRFVEYDGADTEASLSFHPQVSQSFIKAEVVDLMERPTGVSATLKDGVLTVPIKAHSFVTVKLT